MVEIKGIQFINDDIDYESLSDATIKLLYQFVYPNSACSEADKQIAPLENIGRVGLKTINEIASSMDFSQFDGIHVSFMSDMSCLKIELFPNGDNHSMKKMTFFISREMWQTSIPFMNDALNMAGKRLNANVFNKVREFLRKKTINFY